MSTKSPATSVPVDIDSSLFITTMQKMVGGGIRAAKNEYYPTNNKNDHTFTLFSWLCFKHKASEIVNQNDEKYNPAEC